jgi:hypothetical protein
MSKVSFLQIAGAKPFSAFQRTPRKRGKTTVRRTGRRKNVRTRRQTNGRKTGKKSRRHTNRRKTGKKTRRQTNRHTGRNTRRNTRRRRTTRKHIKGRCNCDEKSKYSGNEPSPKGFGYCAHCTPLKVTMKGKDGNLWENKKYSKGKRWVQVRSDMVGGFIRGLY